MIEEAIKAALIAEYDAIPPKEELEKMYTFSERHEKRMAKIFADFGRQEIRRKRLNLVRKVAIIVIAILALAFVSVKFVPVVYAYVKEWLTEDKDDRVRYEGKSSERDMQDVEKLQFELGYVPDGYELVRETEYTRGSGVTIYKNDEGNTIKLVHNKVTASELVAVNIEGAEVKEINVDGVIYTVFKCQGMRTMLVWEYRGYVCKLEGIFDETELISIAKALTTKK